jgi:hypothetical protein
MLLRVLIRSHFEVMRQVKVSLWIFIGGLKVDKKRVLHCKYSVVVNVLAIAVKDLGYNGLVSGGRDLK